MDDVGFAYGNDIRERRGNPPDLPDIIAEIVVNSSGVARFNFLVT